jgi:hypothetical protein
MIFKKNDDFDNGKGVDFYINNGGSCIKKQNTCVKVRSKNTKFQISYLAMARSNQFESSVIARTFSQAFQGYITIKIEIKTKFVKPILVELLVLQSFHFFSLIGYCCFDLKFL